jgi:PhoPQ-activated pathogenicity-related protein
MLQKKSKQAFSVQKLIFFFENHAIFLDNVERNIRTRQATDDNKIWDMRIACGMTKATETHSDCNTHIVSLRQPYFAPKYLTVTFVLCFISC